MVIRHDHHGRQSYAYKVIKHLNRQDMDCVVLNNIPEAEWLSFYKSLWYDESLTEDGNTEGSFDNNVDLLYIEELDLALGDKKKHSTAPGPDNMPSELFKCCR